MRSFILFHLIIILYALFSAVISLIGINWCYKAFKFLFKGKEVLLFLCWLIFPGLLFWTSGLFKEAPTLFIMGLLLISLKRILIDKDLRIKNMIFIVVTIIVSFLLKPFILVPVLLFSVVFFSIYAVKVIKIKSLVYVFFSITFVGFRKRVIKNVYLPKPFYRLFPPGSLPLLIFLTAAFFYWIRKNMFECHTIFRK